MRIADLKPYPAMKDSGVPWLGGVPAHWNVTRARYLFREVDRRSQAGEETHLSMSQTLGLVPSAMVEQRTLISESYAGGKLCEPGDLVLNRLKAHLGVFARARQGGVISADYTVLQRRRPLEVQYFEETLRSPACRSELRFRAKGIVEGFWRLYTDDFYDIRLPEPPAEEQAAIVRFLGHTDRQIRRYIRAKQRLTELLEEQKRTIMHRAVTRGLDPSVRLKPSGVERLGDVPEHWTLARLKDVALIQTGVTLGKNYTGMATESRPYLRVANVQAGRLDLRHIKRIDVSPTEAKGATLRSGDVLMTEGGDIDKLGRGCVWRDEIPACVHQNHVFAVRCRERVLVPEFLAGLMGSQVGREYFQLTAKQTTNLASTNSSTLRAFPIPIPLLPEQHAILDAIAKETTALSVAIDRAECEISLLREFRTRLIADVVTGKLDVREAAAALPDEAGEPEPLDDAAAVDPDETTDDVDLDTTGEEDEA